VNALLEPLQIAALFVVGILARLLVLALFVAAIGLPILLFVELFLVVRRLAERRTTLVHGVALDGSLRYSPGHAWLSRRLGRLRVGVDALAARILSGAEAVDLPSPGTVVTAGGLLAVVRVAGRQACIFAPVSGTVVAVNREVGRDPSLLERSPYHRGWLVAIRPLGDAWRSLISGNEAREWLASEERRLGHLLECELGMAAADGGDLVIPPGESLSNEAWYRVVGGILGSGSGSSSASTAALPTQSGTAA